MLKILTLNIHSIEEVKGLSKNWTQRFEALAGKILEERYDIIAFQEVNQSLNSRILTEIELYNAGYFSANNGQIVREDNFAFQLAKYLKEKGLNYSWNYNMAHIGYKKYEEGTAIFSLRKVRAAKSFLCSDESVKGTWRYRVQTGMKIQGDKEIFWCISSHFSWWNHAESLLDDFQHEWNFFQKAIKPFTDKTIIVIGNFNNPPQIANQGYDYITKDCHWNDMFLTVRKKEPLNFVSVVDVVPGWDEKPENGNLLDYAVCNKNFMMNDGKIVFDGKNGEVVSDHFGVQGAIDL